MKYLLISILLIFYLNIYSQNSKYVLWYYPSNVNNVYGVMITVSPDYSDSIRCQPKVHGIELDLTPEELLLSGFTFAYLFYKPFYEVDIKTINNVNLKTVNGVRIGFTDMEESIINGINLSLGDNLASKTNGLTISMLRRKNQNCNGVGVSLIANLDNSCNGIQIGLINKCSDLKGFQFGLWNKNQKRSLPIINWSFN